MDCKNEFKYEYCTGEYLACSDDNYFRTRCYVSIFSNGCKLNRHYHSCMESPNFGNFYESYGPSSICLRAIVSIIRIIMALMRFVLIMSVLLMGLVMMSLNSFLHMRIDLLVRKKDKLLMCLDGVLRLLVEIPSIFARPGSSVIRIVMGEASV